MASSSSKLVQGGESLATDLLLPILSSESKQFLRVSSPIALPPASQSVDLLAISDSNGLIAIAAPPESDEGPPTSILVHQTTELRKLLKGSAKGEKPELKQPWRRLSSPKGKRISSIKFAQEDSCVVAALEDATVVVWGIEQLKANQLDPASIVEPPVPGSTCHSLLPNPSAYPNYVFLLVSQGLSHAGKPFMIDLNSSRIIPVPMDTGSASITAACWSVKGKQLALGLSSGEILQVTPDDAAIKARLPRPSSDDLQPESYVSDIFWIENDAFIIGYNTPEAANGQAAEDPPHDDFVFALSRSRDGSLTYTALSDPSPAFGLTRLKSKRYISHLKNWSPFKNAVFMTGAPSTDVGLLARKEEAELSAWETLELEETSRPTLPFSSTDNESDTAPLGLALDLSLPVGGDQSAERPIDPRAAGRGEDESKRMPYDPPLLWLLNSDGILGAWWVLNLADATASGYPGMISPGSDATASVAAPPDQAPAPSAFGSVGNSSGTATGFAGFALPQNSPSTSIQDSQTSPQPAFGSSPVTSFGKTPGSVDPTSSAFGQSGALGPQSSATAPAKAPAFGSPSSLGSTSAATAGAFGGFGQTSAFGAPSKPTPTSFGTSAFGQASGFGQQSSAFGKPAALGNKPQSAFGGTTGPSAFSTTASTGTGFGSFGGGGSFAALAAKKPSETVSAFGSAATSPAPSGGGFGAFGGAMTSTFGGTVGKTAGPSSSGSIFGSGGSFGDLVKTRPVFGEQVKSKPLIKADPAENPSDSVEMAQSAASDSFGFGGLGSVLGQSAQETTGSPSFSFGRLSDTPEEKAKGSQASSETSQKAIELSKTDGSVRSPSSFSFASFNKEKSPAASVSHFSPSEAVGESSTSTGLHSPNSVSVTSAFDQQNEDSRPAGVSDEVAAPSTSQSKSLPGFDSPATASAVKSPFSFGTPAAQSPGQPSSNASVDEEGSSRVFTPTWQSSSEEAEKSTDATKALSGNEATPLPNSDVNPSSEQDELIDSKSPGRHLKLDDQETEELTSPALSEQKQTSSLKFGLSMPTVSSSASTEAMGDSKKAQEEKAPSVFSFGQQNDVKKAAVAPFGGQEASETRATHPSFDFGGPAKGNNTLNPAKSNTTQLASPPAALTPSAEKPASTFGGGATQPSTPNSAGVRTPDTAADRAGSTSPVPPPSAASSGFGKTTPFTGGSFASGFGQRTSTTPGRSSPLSGKPLSSDDVQTGSSLPQSASPFGQAANATSSSKPSFTFGGGRFQDVSSPNTASSRQAASPFKPPASPIVPATPALPPPVSKAPPLSGSPSTPKPRSQAVESQPVDPTPPRLSASVTTLEPQEVEEQGLQGEFLKIYLIMEKELKLLKSNIAQCMTFQALIRESGAGLDLQHPQSLALGDLPLLFKYESKLKERVESVVESVDQRQRDLAELEAGLFKAEAKREEAARFLRAFTDPEFAKLVRIRELGPEHLQNQAHLRALTQTVKTRAREVESCVLDLRSRIRDQQLGRTHLKIPSIDAIQRTVRNISLTATAKSLELDDLLTEFELLKRQDRATLRASLRASSVASRRSPSNGAEDASISFVKTPDAPLHSISALGAALPNTDRRGVGEAVEAAVKARQTGRRLANSLIQARKEPILNQSAARHAGQASGSDKRVFQTSDLQMAFARGPISVPSSRPLPAEVSPSFEKAMGFPGSVLSGPPPPQASPASQQTTSPTSGFKGFGHGQSLPSAIAPLPESGAFNPGGLESKGLPSGARRDHPRRTTRNTAVQLPPASSSGASAARDGSSFSSTFSKIPSDFFARPSTDPTGRTAAASGGGSDTISFSFGANVGARTASSKPDGSVGTNVFSFGQGNTNSSSASDVPRPAFSFGGGGSSLGSNDKVKSQQASSTTTTTPTFSFGNTTNQNQNQNQKSTLNLSSSSSSKPLNTSFGSVPGSNFHTFAGVRPAPAVQFGAAHQTPFNDLAASSSSSSSSFGATTPATATATATATAGIQTARKGKRGMEFEERIEDEDEEEEEEEEDEEEEEQKEGTSGFDIVQAEEEEEEEDDDDDHDHQGEGEEEEEQEEDYDDEEQEGEYIAEWEPEEEDAEEEYAEEEEEEGSENGEEDDEEQGLSAVEEEEDED